MSIDDPTDTLDRLVDDSVFSTITIKKFKSTHQVNVIYLAVPPPDYVFTSMAIQQ